MAITTIMIFFFLLGISVGMFTAAIIFELIQLWNGE